MKKIIKRFIAFVFATALFLAPLTTPITTFAASSSPVLEFEAYYPDEVYARGYKYEIPATVAPGTSIMLTDAAGYLNGQWQVPRYKGFNIYANFTGMSNVRVEVIDISSGNIVYSMTTNNFAFSLDIPANNSYYPRYHIIVTNIGSNTIGVINYAGMVNQY